MLSNVWVYTKYGYDYQLIERMNEWMNEWMNERTNERNNFECQGFNLYYLFREQQCLCTNTRRQE